MERELWPRVHHLVMEVGKTFRLTDVTFQPHIAALVFLWADVHDRPECWACREWNWATTTLRPFTLSSASTLSRRLRRADTVMFMRLIVQRIRETGDMRLITVIGGKPLPVGGASQAPEAHCGRGAARLAKGYKLHAAWSGRPIPATYRVHAMHRNEDKVAKEMIPDLTGGGYLLGEGEYDANEVFDVAGATGYQLLAPRVNPEAGLGHHYQSPYRLRCIDLMESSLFGREIFHSRGGIERDFAHLGSFAGGLSPRPSLVRRENRVWLWVSGKLVNNALRIMMRKGLAA